MRIQLKCEPLPADAKVIRCDEYTPAEWLKSIGSLKRAEALAWMREHPKDVYTDADRVDFFSSLGPVPDLPYRIRQAKASKAAED